MFPPPITMPTSTPNLTMSRTSWAICSSVFGEIPYFPSPISASPLSFRRMRLNLGGLWTRSRGAEAILRPRDGQGAKDNSPDQPEESIRVVGQGYVARCAGWPGEDLDLGECLELDVYRARLQLLEAARGRQEAAVEGPDGAVVRLESALQGTPELGQVPAQVGDSLVQLAAFVRDLARVRGDGLLLPDVRDGEEQREQRRGRGQHDAARERIFVKRRVHLQRRREQAVGGQKQHRHLRTAREGLPVLLARERIDVRAQLRGVRLQVRPTVGFRRLDRLQIRFERDLRVEEDRLLAGQADRDVGPQDAICQLRDGLLVEVDVGA